MSSSHHEPYSVFSLAGSNCRIISHSSNGNDTSSVWTLDTIESKLTWVSQLFNTSFRSLAAKVWRWRNKSRVDRQTTVETWISSKIFDIQFIRLFPLHSMKTVTREYSLRNADYIDTKSSLFGMKCSRTHIYISLTSHIVSFSLSLPHKHHLSLSPSLLFSPGNIPVAVYFGVARRVFVWWLRLATHCRKSSSGNSLPCNAFTSTRLFGFECQEIQFSDV